MMNFVLGFGATEEAFVQAEERKLVELVTSLMQQDQQPYFTDALVDQVRAWLKARSKELQEAYGRYKHAADHPDRYSEYWPTVLADASHIVVIMKLLHVNRRHPASPDGWGCMQERRVVVIDHHQVVDQLAAA